MILDDLKIRVYKCLMAVYAILGTLTLFVTIAAEFGDGSKNVGCLSTLIICVIGFIFFWQKKINAEN